MNLVEPSLWPDDSTSKMPTQLLDKVTFLEEFFLPLKVGRRRFEMPSNKIPEVVEEGVKEVNAELSKEINNLILIIKQVS